MAIRLYQVALFTLGLLGWALPAAGSGGIVGQCADCHTMHNSEQGRPVAQHGLDREITGEAVQNLLRYDCIACHAQDPGGPKIAALDGGSQVPQVYHSDTTGDLAAGNFAYISGAKTGHGEPGPRKGHNVVDLVNADTVFTDPPGFRDHSGSGFAFDASGFTCAGNMGCHGYRGQILEENNDCDPWEQEECSDIYRTGLSALSGFEGEGNFFRGAHHQSRDGLKMGGSSPEFAEHPLAGSYRFLHAMRGYGNEIDRWQNVDSSSHNEYFGRAEVQTDYSAATCSVCHLGGQKATTARVTTPFRSVTGFCVTCHGEFHSSGVTNGTSGAFLRHPSDYVIPNAGEYAGYTAYNVSAPVGRPADSFAEGMVPSAEVRPGTDMVMCLSCHMAHASPYDGMLRFDYTTMVAGGNTERVGCLACHTVKGVAVAER